MAILLLIRHGQNDMLSKKLAGRMPGVHLNQEGEAQARRLAAELAELPIKAVFASPLARAQETALPIARVHDLPVNTLPDVIEIDFGTWQGKSFKQLRRRKLWKDVQERPSEIRFPDGESFQEAQKRIVDGLRELGQKFSEKELVVCVAHSDVIRLAVAHFLGLPLDNFQRLRISPASVSVLHLNGDESAFGPINHQFDFPHSYTND